MDSNRLKKQYESLSTKLYTVASLLIIVAVPVIVTALTLYILQWYSADTLSRNTAKAPSISILEMCRHSISEGWSDENCTLFGINATEDNTWSAQFKKFSLDHTFVYPAVTEYPYVKFNCSASFPVTWVHTQDKWIFGLGTSSAQYHVLRRKKIYYKRQVSNIFEPTTFAYSATIVLHSRNFEVGEYVCGSVSSCCKKEKSARMRIFKIPNTHQPYNFPLSESRKNITLLIPRYHGRPFVLPCYVGNPDAIVKLSKLTQKGTWETVETGHGVSFLPELGFVQSYGSRLSPGTYGCSVANETLLITLESGKASRPSIPTGKMIPPAKFTTDVNLRKKTVDIACCSGGSWPPDMKMAMCTDKIACNKYIQYSPDLDVPWAISPSIGDQIGNCIKMESLMLINVRSMGVRCSGFGINAYKTLVVPLSYYGLNPNQNATSNENTQLYTSWDEVDPSTMMEVFVNPEKPATNTLYSRGRLTLLEGETFFFECFVAPWFFEEGILVTMNLKNGSSFPIEENVFRNHYWPSRSRKSILLTLTKDMKSISCYAPILGSTQFGVKSIPTLLKDL